MRDLQIERLVPKRELVAQILVNVAAGIILEKAPIDEAVRIEVAAWRVAQKRVPGDVLGRHVRIDRPRPLRFAMRRIAVPVHADGCDFAHMAGCKKVDRVAQLAGRAGLMTDLDNRFRRLAVSRAHAPGILQREGQRLFLIHVLARLERVNEVLRNADAAAWR